MVSVSASVVGLEPDVMVRDSIYYLYFDQPAVNMLISQVKNMSFYPLVNFHMHFCHNSKAFDY